MSKARTWKAAAAMGAALLVGGCAGTASNGGGGVPGKPDAVSEPTRAEQSGFLADYSKLAEEKDTAGETVLRYVSPNLKRGVYQKLIIDAAQFYPAPQPSEYVDQQTLNDIRLYVDKGLREKLGTKMSLVAEPGPGVLRLRPAITSVAAASPGLKPYEILPIGFLISAAAGRGKDAAIAIEFEAVDSATGERMGAAVRKGVGVKLKSDETKLTLEHLKPLLDQWTTTGSAFLSERL